MFDGISYFPYFILLAILELAHVPLLLPFLSLEISQCTSCPGSSYQDQASHTSPSCKDYTTCLAGKYVAVVGSLTSDRACAACTLGVNYQDQTNQPVCASLRLCGAGEKLTIDATLSTDRKCGPCVAGKYQSKTKHADKTCLAHTACGAGMYIKVAGTASTDANCEACTTETFQDEQGKLACKAATRCQAGQRQQTVLTPTSDRVCTSCILGETYQDAVDHSATACKAVKECQPGTYTNAAPTVSSDTICAGCPVGTFQDAAGQLTCKDCPPDSYQDLTGQISCKPVEDEPCHVTCASCSGPTADSCLSCAAGRVLSGSTCVSECATGFFVSAANMCEACDVSCRECDGPSAADCLRCSGELFLTADKTCSATCPELHWKQTDNMAQVCAQCTVCSDGEYAVAGCTTTTDTVCAAWHVCKAGEESATLPTQLVDRTCRSCVLGQDFAAAAGTELCRVLTPCNFPEIQDVQPTTSSDRACKCDMSGCEKLVRDIYLDLLCRTPDDTEVATGVQACCAGVTQVELDSALREEQTYVERHICAGCTERCSCTAGYVAAALPQGGNTCESCDGVTEYMPLPGQSECLPVTQCKMDEFEFRLPSSTSDRLCMALIECEVGTEWEVEPPTGDTNRECQVYTTCAWNEYDVVKATPTSDRACVKVWTSESFSTVPLLNSDSTPLTWFGDGTSPNRRDADVGNSTWTLVRARALVQLKIALVQFGLDESFASIEIVLVDVSGTELTNVDASVLTGAVRVQIRFTTASAWQTFTEAVTSSAEALTAGWPLVIEPCLPEAFLVGSPTVFSNGSSIVHCARRARCLLGETWAETRGNITSDRACLPVSLCVHSEQTPPTLTSNRVCGSGKPVASTSSATLSTSILIGFGVLGVLVMILLLALILVCCRRQARRKRKASKVIALGASASQTQTSHVNQAFIADAGGLFAVHYEDPDSQRPGVPNPLYQGNPEHAAVYGRSSAATLYDEVNIDGGGKGFIEDDYIDVADEDRTYGEAAARYNSLNRPSTNATDGSRAPITVDGVAYDSAHRLEQFDGFATLDDENMYDEVVNRTASTTAGNTSATNAGYSRLDHSLTRLGAGGASAGDGNYFDPKDSRDNTYLYVRTNKAADTEGALLSGENGDVAAQEGTSA